MFVPNQIAICGWVCDEKENKLQFFQLIVAPVQFLMLRGENALNNVSCLACLPRLWTSV